MFYVKKTDAAELHEILLLENVFTQDLPNFAKLRLAADSMLQFPRNAQLLPKEKGNNLAWNAETASWCFLDEKESSLCQSMREPVKYGELQHQYSDECDAESLRVFLEHLYRRGLLAMDGRPGIDPSIYSKGPLFNDTFMLELTLTEKCNLACSYCFAEADAVKDDLSLELGKRAIDKMLELPNRRFVVKFGGGEPLTKFDLLIQLIDYSQQAARTSRSREPAITFDITTNGTLITEEVIAALKSYPIELQISFDGLPRLHDGARTFLNQRGSHGAVLGSIRTLQANEISFRVITVVRKAHLGKVGELLEYYKNLGIKLVRFNPMIRSGRGSSIWLQDSVTPTEYLLFMKELVDYISETLAIHDDNIGVMVGNTISRTRDFRCMRSPCGAGTTYLNVEPGGNIHPCAYYRSSSRNITMGNVRSKGISFASSYKSDRLVCEMAGRTAHTIGECSACPWRHFCTGGCAFSAYVEHNAFDRPAVLCDFYKNMYPFLLDSLQKNPQLATFLVSAAEPVTLALNKRS